MANKNDSRRTIAQVLGFLRPYRLLVALSPTALDDGGGYQALIGGI